MAESEAVADGQEADALVQGGGPLVFISHDSRDAEIAEAFSKLLRSVSAGMIKTFRSSDKKGTEGIDFGEEWFKRLMSALQSTSDVVCLFTERSIDRPWILFEAGVAKGKLTSSGSVTGLACGVPLSRVSAGPFYQFHNMEDSESDLTKLVQQLARKVPGVELDQDVVKGQIATFRATEADILKKLGKPGGVAETETEDPVSKLAEEMKSLPSRVAERLVDFDDRLLIRRRRLRRFHPMMFEEVMHMGDDPSDPISILLAASVFRDDAPWLYELALEVYRAARSGSPQQIEKEIKRLQTVTEMMRRGPFFEEFGLGDKEMHMMLREFPRVLYHMLERAQTAPRRVVRPRPTRLAKVKPAET